MKKFDGFAGEKGHAVLTYDFSEDGGVIGNIDLAEVGKKMLLSLSQIKVDTLCESGGSAVVTIGASSADPDAFLAAARGAVASLVADYVVSEAAAPDLIVPAGEFIRLNIATAALTAGKIKIYLDYVLVD